MPFADREEAGLRLAGQLDYLRGEKATVLAMLDGGVVVGYTLARTLGLPMDFIATYRIPAPDDPRYTIGVASENDVVVFDWGEVERLGVPTEYVDRMTSRGKEEVRRLVNQFRQGRPLPELAGQTVVIVDEALEIPLEPQAAARAVQVCEPKTLIVAAPVIPADVASALEPEQDIDRVVWLECPQVFAGTKAYFDFLPPVPEEEVQHLLAAAPQRLDRH